MKLGFKEAAERIRFAIDTSRVDPSDRHASVFLEKVAEHLGLDKTAATLQHIAHVLHDHGIEIPRGEEYPKYLGTGPNGETIIANSAEHEQELIAAQGPAEPVDVAGDDSVSTKPIDPTPVKSPELKPVKKLTEPAKDESADVDEDEEEDEE